MANQLPADVPFGYCQCGCGQRTRLAPVNDKSKGWIKGQPLKCIKGHMIRFMSQAGSECHNWKGGRYLTPHGYVMTTLDDGGRQYEHIVIAERILGRKLRFFGEGHPDNEIVHHVRKTKSDNSNGNLLICTHAYHVALHHRLEQSDAWPEFPKVIRRGFGGATR